MPSTGRFNPISVALAARRDWLDAMELLAAGGAPVTRSRFALPLVVVHGRDEAHQVLIRDAGSYGRPWVVRSIMRDALGHMLFTTDGDEWVARRKAVAPAFGRAHIEAMASEIVHTTRDEFERAWSTGPVDDLQAKFTDLTMRIAARALLGVDPFVDPLGASIADNFQILLDWITFRFRHLASPPAVVPTRQNLRMRTARRELGAAVMELVQRRRSEREARHDVLALLLTDPGRADREIVSECVGFLFAGHETTASTLTWAAHELAARPGLQHLLANEGSSVESAGSGHFALSEELHVTGRVVNETLRLYPSGVGIARVATRRTSIGDVVVPRGTTVLVGVYSMHRSSAWDRPNQFDPYRSFPHPEASAGPAFLPFGWGPRRCLGARFATAELRLVLAMICANWELERTLRTPPKPAVIPSLRVDGPLPMVLGHRAVPSTAA